MAPFAQPYELIEKGKEPLNADGQVQITAFPQVSLVGDISNHEVTVTYPAGQVSGNYVVQVAASGGGLHDPFGPERTKPQIDQLVGEVHVQFLRHNPGQEDHLQVIDVSQMPGPGCTIRYKPIHAKEMYSQEEMNLRGLASHHDLRIGSLWRLDPLQLTWEVHRQGSFQYDASRGEIVIRVPGFAGYSPVLDPIATTVATLAEEGYWEVGGYR